MEKRNFLRSPKNLQRCIQPVCTVFLFITFPILLAAQSPLDPCSEQFIGGTIFNAPTLFNSPPEEPFDTNVHQCYRGEDTSFYALEYWPERYAPRWTAYKLSPENYGENECNTFTRGKMQCYFSSHTWEDFQECTSSHDPFHSDYILETDKLSSNDFSNTGHDRGHIAPGQAFSWHVCGWYQTFTMANMSPQRGILNRQTWFNLERQVVTWAIDAGPMYVISGTLYGNFPYNRFAVYQEGILDSGEIYPRNNTFLPVVEKLQSIYQSDEEIGLLRGERFANPDGMGDKLKDLNIPTGYFKVIYMPGETQEEAKTIGFLIPHSFESLNLLADSIDGLTRSTSFWSFASRIDLIEEVTGIQFPGIPEGMKQWGDPWFIENKTSRDFRRNDCTEEHSPQGFLANSSSDERVEACTVLIDQ